MPVSEIEVSAHALTRIGLALGYITVGIAAWRWLLPSLPQTAKRLAGIFAVAQLLIIVIALDYQPEARYQALLWAVHDPIWSGGEWNIPATLASTQLAFVGGVALLSAGRARRAGSGMALYYLGIALVFLFFALDEYYQIHEYIAQWGQRYRLLGMAVAAATLVAAYYSPRRTRRFFLALLLGLALSAFGAMALDSQWIPCFGQVGMLRFDGCMFLWFWEEALEFLGIWLALVALLGLYARHFPAPPAKSQRHLYALPLLWLMFLLLSTFIPRLEHRLTAQKTQVEYEAGLTLRGYHIESDAENVQLRVFISAPQKIFYDYGYSLQLIDQVSGETLAFSDVYASREHGLWLFGGEYAPLYRQAIGLDIPPDAARNHAYAVALKLWRREHKEFPGQAILKSDLPQLWGNLLLIDELVLPRHEAPARADDKPPLAHFAGGFTLVSAALPARAIPGETLSITFHWESAAAGAEDYTQFLHLRHVASGEWWVYDQQPLGARLPTRLWYAGLADEEGWRLPLPADLLPGAYEVFTGLYRNRDKERAAAADAAGAPLLDNRLALGSIVLG